MTVKEKLARGTPSIGSWLQIGNTATAEIMARSGFDWLCIDLEHSAMDLAEAESLIRIIDLCGVAPLVRLSVNDPVQIKRVMDSGAHGIIVPMVNSAAEAQAAVDGIYYPPRGRRGVGLYRAQGYGVTFEAYKTWLAASCLCIVQVEHIEAVNNLEAILAVDGVDGFIIGPYDLSASLGRPGDFENPEFTAALARIETVGQASGKVRGIHVVEPDHAALRARLAQGYTFVAYSIDTRMLDVACRAGLAAARA
jgi:2-dehydro-3-deoxyglucarate aldolase